MQAVNINLLVVGLKSQTELVWVDAGVFAVGEHILCICFFSIGANWECVLSIQWWGKKVDLMCTCACGKNVIRDWCSGAANTLVRMRNKKSVRSFHFSYFISLVAPWNCMCSGLSSELLPLFLLSLAGGDLLLWGQIPCVSRVTYHAGPKGLSTPQPFPLAGRKVRLCLKVFREMIFIWIFVSS